MALVGRSRTTCGVIWPAVHLRLLTYTEYGTMTGHRQVAAVRVGAFVVLLFALAPNILYVGHWGPGAEQKAHAHDSGTAQAGHAEHCHGNANQCDAPAMVSVSWVIGESLPQAPPDALLIAILPPFVPGDLEATVAVIKPPPRTSETIAG